MPPTHVCRRRNCVILRLKSSPPCVTSVLPVRFEGAAVTRCACLRRLGRTRTALSENDSPHLWNACPNGISNFASCRALDAERAHRRNILQRDKALTYHTLSLS